MYNDHTLKLSYVKIFNLFLCLQIKQNTQVLFGSYNFFFLISIFS